NTLLNPNIAGRTGGGAGSIPYAGETPSIPQRVRDAFASVMPAERASFDNRFSLWGSVYGASGSISGNAATGSTDTTSHTYGFAVGLDPRIGPAPTVGFALAGGGTSWGVAEGLGNGRSDMFQAGFYGTKQWGPVYASAALAYSWHDVTTTRTVTVAGSDIL